MRNAVNIVVSAVSLVGGGGFFLAALSINLGYNELFF